MERQGIVNIQNLGSVAPSFATSNAQIASGSVVLRIRGVGTTSNNIGFESAVGIFVDGAYQSRPGIALGEFVDVERVEVLRGPQGTLFGRNTSAGALNITNVRPDLNEAGGFVNATYGNYDHKSLQGAVNIPLVEGKVAARLTGAWRDRDGYVDIQDASGTKIGESNSTDQYYLRAQVGFEGEEKWKGRIVLDHSSSDNNCCSAIEVLRSPVEAGGVFGLVGLGARGGMSADNVATSATDFDGAQAAVDDLTASSGQVPNPSSVQTGIVAELEYAINDSMDVNYVCKATLWMTVLAGSSVPIILAKTLRRKQSLAWGLITVASRMHFFLLERAEPFLMQLFLELVALSRSYLAGKTRLSRERLTATRKIVRASLSSPIMYSMSQIS